LISVKELEIRTRSKKWAIPTFHYTCADYVGLIMRCRGRVQRRVERYVRGRDCDLQLHPASGCCRFARRLATSTAHPTLLPRKTPNPARWRGFVRLRNSDHDVVISLSWI